MIKKTKWTIILADVIQECVKSVTNDNPFEVDPWIMLEEIIGYDETKALFTDADYFHVTKALDLFCHAAQHDRDEVEGISLSDLSTLLINSSEALRNGSLKFPDELRIFGNLG